MPVLSFTGKDACVTDRQGCLCHRLPKDLGSRVRILLWEKAVFPRKSKMNRPNGFQTGLRPARESFPRRLARLAATLVWLGFWTATWVPAQDQALPCAACHDDITVAASVHQDLGCTDCHSNIPSGPHPENPLSGLAGVGICTQCHDTQAADLDQSVHGGVLDCTACHGSPHEILAPSNAASSMHPLKQIQTCGQCHDSKEILDGYLASVHGRALVVSGLVNAPACSVCHGSHAIFPPADDRSRVSQKQVPETCGACHQYLFDTWRDRSSHGRAWKKGKKTGPVCTTCHSSHQVMEPRSEAQRLRFPEACGGCHGDRYASYRDSFHGQVTDLGYLTAATCSDCHTPHESLPMEDPESTVNAANLATTCGKCHTRANASFLSFDPHSDPAGGGGNPVVRFIYLAMTTLLIAVFGLFGLHDLLWLQRSAVALIRGEAAKLKPPLEGPYVRRFRGLEIRLHVIIIVSFLLLAATGLPLKFHFAEWAVTLSGLFGGINLARQIHRLAAIATFGYALVHLGNLFSRIVVGKDYGLLWGWRSMTPRAEDFADLLKNVRYFLYIGPRPSMSRWSYWEKFDYFAVFWGVAIIGFSGLMLWFPGFFTLFLPGWTLNAAFIIHSDEALLATGFIFCFHFFHTHLRPEVFPLDPVVFTGVMPLRQFKEERPREYAHLVERGELEALLVGPPEPATLRRAKIFGFSAVAVGTALLIGILASFLSY